ncbi:MAG TPA: hypothetical protein VGZ26_00575 [Pirellulales bacterium]|nr:hypothetical protein [Pirellulales bacterium]
MKTSAGRDTSAVLQEEAQSIKTSDAWQHLIDYQLIEWGRNPRDLEDDGLKAPTSAAIEQAIEISARFSALSLPAPTAVVPDGIGGIVFERREGASATTLRVSSTGSVEFVEFRDGALLRRCRGN